MGATGWSYFVPYEADITTALQRLRQDVFVRGDYIYRDGLTPEDRQASIERIRPALGPWVQRCREIAADLPEPKRAQYIEMAEQAERELLKSGMDTSQSEQKPQSIEELLQRQAANGTHSVLDMVGLSPKPKFGAISPFPRAKLIELFDSETPNHAEIEEAYESGSLEKYVSRRWQGIYIIVYRDGSPDELFFAGCSGD
ncbi:hypothetical protein Cflav_PD0837 [Pedosphaera parvula Ellin514]|uniref:Uncharacterized protein n=2 Tax=Pedosphaera TaxID=1032526 RepID=B9XQG2_PEDPL|nr:hypothetical protein Cflav_PD0837 [Pedosphaera parvula Ellin514]